MKDRFNDGFCVGIMAAIAGIATSALVWLHLKPKPAPVQIPAKPENKSVVETAPQRREVGFHTSMQQSNDVENKPPQ